MTDTIPDYVIDEFEEDTDLMLEHVARYVDRWSEMGKNVVDRTTPAQQARIAGMYTKVMSTLGKFKE